MSRQSLTMIREAFAATVMSFGKGVCSEAKVFCSDA